MRTMQRVALATILTAASSMPLRAQEPPTFDACYVPSVGVIYLINQQGLPTACLAASHVAFTWTSSGTLGDGTVTEAQLAFDPATQAELDALFAALAAAGTLNDPSNPIDWTQLKNVPADFADGVDNGGVGATDHGALTGLADDDHTQYLLGDGVRNVTDGFAVSGAVGTGSIPVSGAGVRLMWYPGKAALRAGQALGTDWDDANVGLFSVGAGWRPTASGSYSISLGNGTAAAGDNSVALGFNTAAPGRSSTATGGGTLASGVASTAMGSGSTASGDVSTAMGYGTTAQAYGSLVIGRYNVMSGDQTSWLATDPLLVAGNGDFGTPSNAMTLFKNGNLDLAGTLTASAFVGDGSGLTGLPSGVNDHGALTGLTDDDHPQYLLGDGVRDATDGFAVTGTWNSGAIPATGAGTRIMWYPRKAAFRAGSVPGQEWDDANIGGYSVAMGSGTTASGGTSVALGQGTTASGGYSTALGWGTTAGGYSATAMGNSTTASGGSAVAMGGNTTASGSTSTAMGLLTTASGTVSTAMGLGTTAQAFGSLTIGQYNVVSGTGNLWIDTEPLFVAGNGVSAGTPSNALTLYKNGNLELGGTVTAADGLVVTGNVSGTIPAQGVGRRLMWYGAKSALRAGYVNGGHWDDANIGVSSMALGFNTIASGFSSTAMGNITSATGDASTALGESSTASGFSSTAMGRLTQATGYISTALGSDTEASANYSTSMGVQTTASGQASTAMGSNTTAGGTSSTAMGSNTAASGLASTATGSNTIASGNSSTASGYGTAASGQGSTSMGQNTTASGDYSVAVGYDTQANANNTVAMGYGTIANEYASLVIGRYNVHGSIVRNSWIITDQLFVVGNGSGDAARSNALTLWKTGNMMIAGSLTENSDIRLKTDIQPLQSALEAVLDLTPIRYRFLPGTGHPTEEQIGLSAQELQAAFPELVRADAQGSLSVAYPKLTAVLIRALQEQQAQIDELRAEVEALRER